MNRHYTQIVIGNSDVGFEELYSVNKSTRPDAARLIDQEVYRLILIAPDSD